MREKSEMQFQKVNFTSNQGQEFHQTLVERVDAYFSERHISKKANLSMVFKSILYLSLLVFLYFILIAKPLNTGLTYVVFAALGFVIALVGINICHDAIHGAYAKSKRVNAALGFVFNIIGASAYMWKILHNIVHHSFTNIEGHDEDIDIVPILRLSPNKSYKKIMRYQHIYAFGLYSLSSLSWVFIKDYKKFFAPKIGQYDNRKHPIREYYFLFLNKLMYYFLFIALPLILMPMPWWKILLGFLILHLVEGLTIAVIFVLAHVVEGPEFPEPDSHGSIEHGWAVHQLKTTSNFCRQNRLLNFICGGLNFQIEHHLFPKICHIHYRGISEIVKATALEYNLEYYDQPSFLGTLTSHIRVLKRFGAAQ